MATRAGPGPSAELLEALRACCPDVADEAFEAVVAMLEALGEDAGDGDGDGGEGAGDGALRWRSLTLGEIPGLAELLGVIAAPAQAVAALLDVVAGILDILASLLIDILDPLRALVLAAYELLSSIIEDLLGSGAYLYADVVGLDVPSLTRPPVPTGADPQPWVPGGPPLVVPPGRNGFDAWADRFQASFDDPGDAARPTFSDGAPVEALFIVGTAPDVHGLSSILPLLEKLFDAKSFTRAWDAFAETFPVIPPDPTRTRGRTTPVAPDWRSWRLRDVAPPDYPLQKLLWVPWLLKTLLLNTDSVIGLLRKLAAAVKEKAELLRKLVDILQGLIDALLALTATGLHVLAVVTDEGVEGLTTAFREAHDRPGTDEDGQGLGADLVAGVCLLTGTSELAGAATIPVWALLGQERSFAEAYAGLMEDGRAIAAESEKAYQDTVALAQGAWSGTPGEPGDTTAGKGVAGLGKDLVTELKEITGDQLVPVLERLGIDAEELEAWAADEPARVVAAVDQARADGVPIDPRVLAHLEATRRAGGRGNRSLAAALGLRDPGIGR
jgi:hypothetical protein